ncbi:MAG: putative ubiquitin-conjugating enzyme E2 [Benniella sp.]|nr:NEDD8-conjugating protein ubc12 [Mortierella sp. NVP85]KAK3825749.1 MAG: putative ubiquitin-conjugating enzyme E2 [Benniella sp.]
MIKIWSMKKDNAGTSKNKPKVSPGQIRVQKDLTELDLPKTMLMDFPVKEDLLNFELYITPDEGFYKGGTFKFSFSVSGNYPHDAPSVKCLQKIYHPNIQYDGKICLNILREDWKPVLTLNSIMVGLQYLLLEPNADDPLNKEAAEDLRTNRRNFESNVARSIKGGSVNGIQYDDVTKVALPGK